MLTFSELFKKGWNTTFKGATSFWSIFVLTGFFTLLINILVTLLESEQIQNILKGFIEELLREPANIILSIIILILCILVTIIVMSYATFLGQIGMTKTFQGKKVSWKVLTAENHRFLSSLGTVIVQFLVMSAVVFGIGLFLALGAGLYVFTTQMMGVGESMITRFVGGGAILLGIGLWLAAIIYVGNMLIFTFSAFYLDGKTGIGALKTSKNLVHGRWWKTFSVSFIFFLCVGLLAAALSFPFGIGVGIMSEILPVWGFALEISSTVVQSILQIIGQMIFFVMLLALYEEYKKHPAKTLSSLQ